MWFYRSLMRISWVKKLLNEKEFQMKIMERSPLIIIRKRQLNFVGCAPVRKDWLEKLVLDGKIKGRRQRERQRLKHMDGFSSAVGCSVIEVFWCAGDRIGFR